MACHGFATVLLWFCDGFPMVCYGFPMVLQWFFYALSCFAIVLQWFCNGIAIVFQCLAVVLQWFAMVSEWFSNGFAMVCPGFAMVLLWFAMVLLWFAMVLQWCCHGLQWLCHGFAVWFCTGLQWICHRFAMVCHGLLWFCDGFAMVCYGFRMVLQWFAMVCHGFALVFVMVCNGFAMVLLWFALVLPWGLSTLPIPFSCILGDIQHPLAIVFEKRLVLDSNCVDFLGPKLVPGKTRESPSHQKRPPVCLALPCLPRCSDACGCCPGGLICCSCGLCFAKQFQNVHTSKAQLRVPNNHRISLPSEWASTVRVALVVLLLMTTAKHTFIKKNPFS